MVGLVEEHVGEELGGREGAGRRGRERGGESRQDVEGLGCGADGLPLNHMADFHRVVGLVEQHIGEELGEARRRG